MADSTRRGPSRLAWWIVGGAALLVVAIVLVVVLVPKADTSAGDDDAAGPSASATADPGAPALADGVPVDLTFEAGGDIPGDLVATYEDTFAGDAAWGADETADVATGSFTYTHIASGCVLHTFTSSAAGMDFDPDDDYANSVSLLNIAFGVETITDPASVTIPAAGGDSQLEAAVYLSQLEDGAGGYVAARGFGQSDSALLVDFACADFATTEAQFTELALPKLNVQFSAE
jgi:hypothetical protein